MLNLTKYINKYNKTEETKIKKITNKNTMKNFPSSTREWNNSIYTFNKNYLSLISDKSKIAMKLIKSYFNLYNKNIENKLRKLDLRLRFRRLSSNKIYISNGTFKHTNNKVIITIFVYNRQKLNYIYLLRRKFKEFLIVNLSNNLLLIKNEVQEFVKKETINNLIATNVIQNETNIPFLIKKNLNKLDLNKIYKILLQGIYSKYKKHLIYKQLLFINKSKLNFDYLIYLRKYLNKIYKKNVVFNIVNLKNFYSNSDIFTESILLKVKRDRRKLSRKLKSIIIKSKIIKVSKFIDYKPKLRNLLSLNKNIDYIDYLILNNLYKNKKTIKRTVIDLIKHKRVTGVRLEAQGRLTKRFTASRSLSKLNYKGNIKNIDSSYLGISSVLLRGNLRSNLQYTKLASKSRIGSFGLKGWVSGY